MVANRNDPRYFFPKRYADWVQRLRVPFGFVLLVGFAWLADPTLRSMAVGLPVALIGLWLRGWAAGHLAKNEHLATSGPFAYMRNPLYAGTVVVALGILIAARNSMLAVISLVAFAIVYLPAIELEEQHLRNIFVGYAEYARRVYRFLPVHKWGNSEASFSWALYHRNEEYKAALGFLIAVAWLGWKCWLRESVT